MMTALPLMPPPLTPLPILAIAQPAIVTVASFEAVLADVAPQPVIANSAAPTEPAADPAQLKAPVKPVANDTSAPGHVSMTEPEVDRPPVAETVEAGPASEFMVAAQIIAVAAQVASRPVKLTASSEFPQQNSIAVGAKKTEAPVRPRNVNVAPVIAKLQNDPEPAETTAPEIEPVAQNAHNLPPIQRSAAEPAIFTLPTIAVSTNIQPQIFHELDLARDLAWIGNLAQDIVAASDDRDHLSFRLMPRSLGQLDVDLSRSPDGLRIEVTATTERATQIIAAEQPRLIDELRQSGIKATGTDLQAGQHPGSQRGHPPPRVDLPFFNTPTRSDKPTTRPDGRFA